MKPLSNYEDFTEISLKRDKGAARLGGCLGQRRETPVGIQVLSKAGYQNLCVRIGNCALLLMLGEEVLAFSTNE